MKSIPVSIDVEAPIFDKGRRTKITFSVCRTIIDESPLLFDALSIKEAR
jgi:hypothetical protein